MSANGCTGVNGRVSGAGAVVTSVAPLFGQFNYAISSKKRKKENAVAAHNFCFDLCAKCQALSVQIAKMPKLQGHRCVALSLCPSIAVSFCFTHNKYLC